MGRRLGCPPPLKSEWGRFLTLSSPEAYVVLPRSGHLVQEHVSLSLHKEFNCAVSCGTMARKANALRLRANQDRPHSFERTTSSTRAFYNMSRRTLEWAEDAGQARPPE